MLLVEISKMTCLEYFEQHFVGIITVYLSSHADLLVWEGARPGAKSNLGLRGIADGIIFSWRRPLSSLAIAEQRFEQLRSKRSRLRRTCSRESWGANGHT